MTLEELLEAMRALIDAATAEDRPLSEEEAERYEDMERQVAALNRTVQIRSRQTAYDTPTGHGGTNTTDRDAHDARLRAEAFERYLRTGDQGIAAEFRAQSEGVGSEGGFLVPTEFRQKIIERMVAFGGLAENAETMSTSNGAPIEWPTLDDTANLGEITPENAQFGGGADLVFGTASLGAYKYTTTGVNDDPLRVSVELLQDSAFDIQALISRVFGQRIARAQALDFVLGTGVGEPQGIAGSTITADETVDVADVIDYDDLLDLEGALDPAYEQGAKWLMSKATWSAIRGIVDGSQRPLIFDQAASGIGGRPEKQLLGYPVVIDQAMPDLSAAVGPAIVAILGDLREAYLIRRVANLTVVVNPYSRANFGQVEFTGWERADGVVQNRNAFVALANQ
ncbi:MAG TPA: phage major capsid protein [Acidimicrobiia bacterium]|nr:phage major capsid protein [Acidimicrobiia bacterium]